MSALLAEVFKLTPIFQTSQIVRQRSSISTSSGSCFAAAFRVGPDISFVIGVVGHWVLGYLFFVILVFLDLAVNRNN